MAEGVQSQIPEEEGHVQNQEHPLLNPLVMENVFSFMESTATVKDLKNFRLVCQVWSESCQKVWRKVAPLRLGPPDWSIKTRRQGLGAQPPGNYLPVNKFLEMMNNPSRDLLQFQQKPFSNLVLFGIDFTKSVPTCLKHLKSTRQGGNFWNYLNNGQNHHVKSLGFHTCHFPEEAFTAKCLEKLGVVEKLTYVNIQWDIDTGPLMGIPEMQRLSNQFLREIEISGDDPAGFYVFLFACRNLEKLTIRCNYPSVDGKLIDLIQVQQIANRTVEMKKLDALESRFFWMFQDVDLLVRRWTQNRIRFPLELLTLTLESYTPSVQDDFDSASLVDINRIFQPVVALFENTLKNLKVFRAPIYNVLPNNLPLFPGNMPVLEELHLYGNLVGGFGFLERTPNLKVLRIDTRCPSLGNHMEKLYFPDRSPAKVTWFRDQYQPHQEDLLDGTEQEIRLRLRLEHMTKIHLECNLSPETIQFLGGCMPNLKVFKGVMTDDVWKAVCQWMSNLEEVGILRGSQVGEEALTGYYNFDDDGATREPLSIVRLHNLRRFVYMAYCGQSPIGDLSVRRGLLEMPKLGMVYVCVSKQLSVEAEAALKADILNVTVVRNTNENCQGGWDCCEEFNFLREFNS